MLAPFLLPSSILCCLPCDLLLPHLQSFDHQGGMRGPDSDAGLGASMGAPWSLLSSLRGHSLQHLLAGERGRGRLGMEDPPIPKNPALGTLAVSPSA